MKIQNEKLSTALKALARKLGNTPVVDLGDGIFGKVEGANPAGSVKDRAAYYIIKSAVEDGKLSAGGTVVEGTSGNTGIGLAYVAREVGLHAVICMPESMTEERRKMILSYGAELQLTPASEGMAGAVAAAKRIERERGAFIANQFANPASIEAHFKTTAPELFGQLKDVKAVVCGVGSGGTAMGFAKYIAQNGLNCKVIAVEPSSSPLMSEGRAGAHKIQGIGANFIPDLVDIRQFDEIMTVGDDEAISAVRLIYKLTGVKCGISSGAAYAAAKRKRSEIDGNIAVILPDNGERYDSSLYTE